MKSINNAFLSHFFGHHLPLIQGWWSSSVLSKWKVTFILTVHTILSFSENEKKPLLAGNLGPCLIPAIPKSGWCTTQPVFMQSIGKDHKYINLMQSNT